MTLWLLIVSYVVGFICGMIIMALCAVSGRNSEIEER